MSMNRHPEFEELSAYHDGEAPEVAGHVADCPECQAQVADLGSLAAAVAEPPAAMTPAARERAIADALAEAGSTSQRRPGPERPVRAGGTGPERPVGAGGTGPERPVRAGGTGPERPVGAGNTGPERKWARGWVAVASAAAVLVAVFGSVALLRGGERSSDRAVTESATTSGAEALASEPERSSGAVDIDSALKAGDLGEVSDAAALAAKVAPTLRSASATADSAQSAAPPAAGAPRVVGTRPCEIEARENAGGGQLGPVVYVAGATRGGVPLVVLGFAGTADPAAGTQGITLVAMEQDGCQLLFSTLL